MTPAISVQLYSLGSLPASDPAGVIGRLAALGFEEVEPVVRPDVPVPAEMLEWLKSIGASESDLPVPVDVPALKRALDEHGMRAPSSHAQLPEGDAAEAILDAHELLGTTFLVVPSLFNPESLAMEAFDDLDRIKRIADRFNVAADRAASRGMRVGYHNHQSEFSADFDGRSGLEVFFELTEPEVFAEIDVYWAHVAGRDPVELIEALGDRVVLLHVKDGDGRAESPNTALGNGVIDLPAILAAATSARAHVVELEHLDDDQIWPVLEESQRYLASRR
jgi:sugar phosphate isomerase/epimerase